jgi:hypothetical protein
MRHRATEAGWPDPEQLYRVRGWLYRVATAGALLSAGYGLISGERLPLWLALAGAVFGTGTAAVNTSTRTPA